MSNISNTDAVVTESKLKDFYEDIKPFLGCPAYLTSEGTSDYYSTDEKVIGRWTDGKPIYQKTFSITPRRAVWSQQYCAIIETTPQEYNIPDIDCIIQGICYTDGWETLNGKYGAYTCGAQKSVNSNNINFLLLDSARVYACTLRYTKTTDSASTTIQEDPNEYSTDEKIIGKWIDGKPLYQKTLTGTTDANSFASLDTSSLNIEQVVSINGFMLQLNNDKTNCVPFDFQNESLSYYVSAYWSNFNNTLQVVGKNYSNTDFVSTIQYTKTTD